MFNSVIKASETRPRGLATNSTWSRQESQKYASNRVHWTARAMLLLSLTIALVTAQVQ